MGDEGEWIGVGVFVGVWGVPHADMHMHACTCMFNMINMDASMRVAISNLYICACMHIHVQMCVDSPYACRGITRIHRSPSRPRPAVRPTAILINIHEHLI